MFLIYFTSYVSLSDESLSFFLFVLLYASLFFVLLLSIRHSLSDVLMHVTRNVFKKNTIFYMRFHLIRLFILPAKLLNLVCKVFFIVPYWKCCLTPYIVNNLFRFYIDEHFSDFLLDLLMAQFQKKFCWFCCIRSKFSYFFFRYTSPVFFFFYMRRIRHYTSSTPHLIPTPEQILDSLWFWIYFVLDYFLTPVRSTPTFLPFFAGPLVNYAYLHDRI